MSLHDQVIVVTGASSGFGEEIARRCAAAGAHVVLAARSTAKLQQLAAEPGMERAMVVPADVTRAEDIERLRDATLERFGRIDVLVNNAGFGVLDRLDAAPFSDLQEMIDVNLYGAVRCTQAFLPHMKGRGSGQIVFMSSLAGLFTTFNFAFYSATKFAIIAVARTLMLELAGSGVNCVAICPNVALTGFQERADIKKYGRFTRLIGWTTTEAVAKATVRAIEKRTHGEVLIPWIARPLLVLSNAFPGLSRLLIRMVR